MRYRVSIVGLIKGEGASVQDEAAKRLSEERGRGEKSYYANQNVFSNRRPSPTTDATAREEASVCIREI